VYNRFRRKGFHCGTGHFSRGLPAVTRLSRKGILRTLPLSLSPSPRSPHFALSRLASRFAFVSFPNARKIFIANLLLRSFFSRDSYRILTNGISPELYPPIISSPPLKKPNRRTRNSRARKIQALPIYFFCRRSSPSFLFIGRKSWKK